MHCGVVGTATGHILRFVEVLSLHFVRAVLQGRGANARYSELLGILLNTLNHMSIVLR